MAEIPQSLHARLRDELRAAILDARLAPGDKLPSESELQAAHGVSLADAEFQTLEYIQRFAPVEGKAPLAGNTIGTDRMFLAKYMPRVDRWLHYRNVDVSSVKELARRWYPRAYFNAPTKEGGHRALADIRESVRELAYYRETVFVPAPGPTSDDARNAAATAVSSFASGL